MDYGPHLYGIYAAMDDPEIESVYCCKAAQVLWTTALISYIFKRMATEPGIILGMFASDPAARKFSQTKLEPIGRVTKPIADLINFKAVKARGNSTLRKEYPGGFLELFGSNSAGNVKSTTAPLVFVEEPDDANENVGNQGDSIRLLYERTKRVRRAKKILGGTPSLRGFSRVEEAVELSDKRMLPIACHECRECHVLSIDNIHGWEAEKDAAGLPHPVFGHHRPELSVYVCPTCGAPWDDWQRKENIRATVAAAIEAGDPMCGWVATVADRKGVAGFVNLNELYSCLPGAGHEALIRDYLEAEHYSARGDETKKIVFVNSKRGEAYEVQDGRAGAEELLDLASKDPESQREEFLVPREAMAICAGVDTQDNRLAITVRAYGRERRSWLIYAGELYADKGTDNEFDAVWTELDKILFRAFKREGGAAMYLDAVTIDSGGHATTQVYAWVKSRAAKYPTVKIMAGKGSSSTKEVAIFSHPPASQSIEHKSPDKRTKADRYGIKVHIIGTIRAKDDLASAMALNAKGAGRFHYYSPEQLRSDYFDQMTAEAKVPNRSGRKTWQRKAGRACEFWDCEVYAMHAAYAVRIPHLKPIDWDAREVKISQSDLFDEAQALEPEIKPKAPAERRKSDYWG